MILVSKWLEAPFAICLRIEVILSLNNQSNLFYKIALTIRWVNFSFFKNILNIVYLEIVYDFCVNFSREE